MLEKVRRLVRQLPRSVGYEVVRPDWNKDVHEFLRVMFDTLGINIVFDVGSHYGEYGRLLRDHGFQGHIISFEPVSKNFQILRESIRHDRKWTCHNIALGNSHGTISVNVTKHSTTSSILQPSHYGREKRETDVVGTEEVKIRRLDDLFDECVTMVPNPRVYLKLDTQGYDLEVVRGASKSIGRILALQTELSVQPIYDNMTGYAETLAQFRQLGFEMATVSPVDRDRDLRLVEFDCVMIRNGWRAQR